MHRTKQAFTGQPVEVFHLRRNVRWMDSVSGWCFWASFVALVGVIGVSLAAPFVVAAGAEAAVDVLWTLVQFGFASVIGLFLLGIVCNLVGNFSGKRKEG